MTGLVNKNKKTSMKVHATGTCGRCFYSNYGGFKYTFLSMPAKQQEIPKGPDILRVKSKLV